jgi:hypothetical protein
VSASCEPPQDEHDGGHHRIEDKAGEEDGELVLGQVGIGERIVHDRAVDADRGESAGLGAVHDEHAHQQRVDPELDREAERDRRNDRDRRRAHRADRGQHGSDAEHHPGNGADAAADRAHGHVHKPTDRPVQLRDPKQVRDADQDHEDVPREHGEDVVRGHVCRERADEEGRREGEQSHVHRHHDRHGEDRREYEDGYDLSGHAVSSRSTASPDRLAPAPERLDSLREVP